MPNIYVCGSNMSFTYFYSLFYVLKPMICWIFFFDLLIQSPITNNKCLLLDICTRLNLLIVEGLFPK